MKTSLLVVAVVGYSALAGCRALPEPVCESTLLVPIASATGPRTVTLGQTATFNLSYIPGANCEQFIRFPTSTQDSLGGSTGRTVRGVGVQSRYVGCDCVTDTLLRRQTTYQFLPWRRGTFVLQFLTRQNKFITDTLTVR